MAFSRPGDRPLPAIFAALAVVAATVGGCGYQPVRLMQPPPPRVVYDGPTVVPDARVQADLDAVAGAPNDDALALAGRVRALADGAGDDQAALVAQAVYNVARPRSTPADGPRATEWAVRRAFDDAVGREAVAEAAAPLVGSPQWFVRRAARSWVLAGDAPVLYGTTDPPDGPGWRGLVRYLDRAGPAASPAVVDLAYGFAGPGATVAVLRAALDRPDADLDAAVAGLPVVRDATRWFDGVPPGAAPVAVAREHLTHLAGSGNWWVRRYAAEVLRRHPDLRSPAALRRLRRDPSPRVRLAIDDEPPWLAEERKVRIPGVNWPLPPPR